MYIYIYIHSPKQQAIAVNEVVSVCVPDSREVSSEYGSQHGVWVTLQRGQRRAVNAAAHIQSHWLPHLDRAETAVRDNTKGLSRYTLHQGRICFLGSLNFGV